MEHTGQWQDPRSYLYHDVPQIFFIFNFNIITYVILNLISYDPYISVYIGFLRCNEIELLGKALTKKCVVAADFTSEGHMVLLLY